LIAAKYNPTGAPDGTFGTNGLKAGEAPPDLRLTISDVAIDAAGNLIAAGWFNKIGEKRFALARYNPYGELDADFGEGGVAITDIPPGAHYCRRGDRRGRRKPPHRAGALQYERGSG